jgi:hypothetical protein
VIAGAPFTLRWTSNEWHDQHDAEGSATTLGVWFADVPPPPSSSARLLLGLSFGASETQAVVNVEMA